MATVDSLDIQINTSAQKAGANIDKLVGKLNTLSASLNRINGSGLTGLANGVNKLSSAMQGMKNVGTADFTRLAKNIEKLGNINTANLNNAASSMSHLTKAFNQLGGVSANAQQVGVLASNLSKLGYKSINNAITNLPALTSELNNLMTTLSKAPLVSNNVIQMTNALANLASQGGKAGMAANSLNTNLNHVSSSMYGLTGSAGKAITKIKSFSRQLLSSMGIYVGLYGTVKGLKNAVESSMDYIEVLNYFDAAFGQVAENANLSSWKELGYASAEEYANSFAERAKELTSKMTGFEISPTGTLETTGMPSLGLDPSQPMNYQAMFGQMASSMGVASETSLKLSQALTEIGADLASVKNLDFEDVWEDMASGLAGMSRTLDKYGVNIRNVNLQQKLTELGIDANITALNQNDKALLRTIILLESTRYAWGDLADTINQPANQLRLITANFQNLSRTIGNLFLPLVQKVLPYINALVIALQRLFTWIGNLLGIDLSKVTSSIGNTDFSDLIDDTDDLTNGLNEAAKAADKLKKGIRSFDELNVITTQDDSGTGAVTGAGLTSGLLDAAFEDALSEYQKAWDEAFGNMENRAQELADKVEKALRPIRDIIEDFAVGDFFKAGQDVSNLVVSITDFFARAIDNVDWYGIGQKIGDFLAGLDWIAILKSVGNLIWQALKAAIELWEGTFNTAPLETALVSLVAMPKVLKAITATKFVTGLKKLANGAKLVATALAGNQVSSKLLITQYPKLGKAVDAARKALVNFRFGIENGNFLTGLNQGISTIRNNLTGLQKGVITAIAGFAEFKIVSSTFEGLVKGNENLVSGITKISATVAAAAAAIYVALGPAGVAIAAITGVVAAVKGINDAFDEIRAEEIGNTIKNAMTMPGGVALSEIVAQFKTAFSDAASSFDTIKEKSSEMDSVQINIKDTWTEIYKIQEAMENGVLSVEEGKTQLETLFSELATLTEQKFSAMNSAIMSAYGEGGSFRTALESIGADTEGAIDTMITYGYQSSERAKEIAQELVGMDIDSEEYRSLITELSSLTGEMSDFAKATSDFTYDMNSLQGKIDYSEIFLEDGSINTEALQNYLSEASTALSSYEDSLNTAGQEISRQWQEIINSTTATEEQKAVAQAQLDYIPQAIEVMKSDAELQIIQFTDMLQNDFIAKTNQIIDDNVKEWEGKSAVEKWWSGVWGAGTEGEYVKEAVDQQQENINTLSSAIEEAFGDLQKEGVVWASDAAKEIYGALFDSEYIFSDMGSGHYKYTLNENYKDIINGATEGIEKLAEERGQDAVLGYANGFSENEETATTAATTFIEKVMKAIAEAQDSHSPSKITKGLGKDAVDGYSLGISENENEVLSVIKIFSENIISKFSEMISPFAKIGVDAMSGLYNGLESMEQNLYDKAQEIADNIAKTIKTALDIHSPSRVMFELGDYTMQGFQNGLENLYQPIISSVKDFSYELQVAPFKTTESLYKNYQSVYANVPSNNRNAYIENTYNNSNYETNAILREILYAVKEGKNIEINIDRKPVFDAVMSENREAQRLNRSHMLTSY